MNVYERKCACCKWYKFTMFLENKRVKPEFYCSCKESENYEQFTFNTSCCEKFVKNPIL